MKDGEPVLKQVAKDVPVAEITSVKVQQVLADMTTALAEQHRFGVAIAAPQIGVGLRIFIVASKVFANRKKMAGEKLDTNEPNQIFINPKILRTSKKMQQSHESCLSIQGRPIERGPDVAGIVERPEKVTIEYYDEQGHKQQRGTGGFLAAIFDHEIDHLNGVLFIDKTIDEWEIDENFNKVS